MTAGPPTDTDYSPAYQDEYQRLWHEAAADREALRARLRDAEETLRLIEDKWHDKDSMNTARAYFERCADLQEPA